MYVWRTEERTIGEKDSTIEECEEWTKNALRRKRTQERRDEDATIKTTKQVASTHLKWSGHLVRHSPREFDIEQRAE